MRGPHHERAELLGAAIARATEVAGAPIDRVEVKDDRVICTAGTRSLVMSYRRGQEGSLDPITGRLTPIPDSGHWLVEIVEDRSAPRPEQIGLAMAKLLKKRGW